MPRFSVRRMHPAAPRGGQWARSVFFRSARAMPADSRPARIGFRLRWRNPLFDARCHAIEPLGQIEQLLAAVAEAHLPGEFLSSRHSRDNPQASAPVQHRPSPHFPSSRTNSRRERSSAKRDPGCDSLPQPGPVEPRLGRSRSTIDAPRRDVIGRAPQRWGWSLPETAARLIAPTAFGNAAGAFGPAAEAGRATGSPPLRRLIARAARVRRSFVSIEA
jgi:hypothetical protein